ncbi:hypothetical protein FPRO06_03483 [Fusarium proliferatum]|uniref:Uncharacterized protein n=2 Tax=Gibberella intermedia TaxID=948311 RepID=A0A1L7V9N2_FUSPR|nr:uncharacterized protein FPRO_02262 [Fusarium proliferatum ET1]KAG4288661.1 hypothetical protein FPRO06_03483 [Fusarium proliferatum]RBA17443.1 hypothetical protein FPRO05_02167 [Fusarium proliferatum]CVL12215.1 uncharacterized protein FPRN_02159 [Fusarium proliferatum]CZR37478.1 uncharacterized protein FPRO_02262 [Fusarium proliferatum ET1]
MSQFGSEHQDAAGATCPGIAYKDLSPEQQEMSDILYKMEQHDLDLLGIVHLGGDGVFRYLDAERNIHYAIALRPALIKALLDRGPYDNEEEAVFRGVDGTKVPKEQWYNPPRDILPEPLSEEHRKEGREFIHKNKDKIDKNREASKNYKDRLVYIESDHKLG